MHPNTIRYWERTGRLRAHRIQDGRRVRIGIAQRDLDRAVSATKCPPAAAYIPIRPRTPAVAPPAGIAQPPTEAAVAVRTPEPAEPAETVQGPKAAEPPATTLAPEAAPGPPGVGRPGSQPSAPVNRQRPSTTSTPSRLSGSVAAVVAALIATLATGVVVGRQSQSPPEPAYIAATHAHDSTVCLASWYATGEVTATGEPFDPDGLTAASLTLPLGTRVVVTELFTKRSVVVRINDRGPYVDGRCIDLTRTAFGILAPREAGLIPVRIEILSEG